MDIDPESAQIKTKKICPPNRLGSKQGNPRDEPNPHPAPEFLFQRHWARRPNSTTCRVTRTRPKKEEVPPTSGPKWASAEGKSFSLYGRPFCPQAEPAI